MAAAVVQLAKLPAKLNQVIQPLMAALRREAQEPFQTAAAQALAHLMLLCLHRQPCPNDRCEPGVTCDAMPAYIGNHAPMTGVNLE